MLMLSGSLRAGSNVNSLGERAIRRLTREPSAAIDAPDQIALLLPSEAVAPLGCISVAIEGQGCRPSGSSPFFELPSGCGYVGSGDIVRFEPTRGRFRVLYRKNSPHNAFLVTERCDNYCLMCSQPPKNIDDSWILEDLSKVVDLLENDARIIGFSGGEPTLYGDGFIKLLQQCHDRLPQSSIHVLSNGRRFADASFSRKWASVEHDDLMVGIPVYSDLSHIHDHVVQADGAFDETIRGILNLKRLKQQVEIRVVLHKLTYERLPQLARFIARNLLFVDHVALMGLEITGFTRANLDILWIDPTEYQSQLLEAATLLDDFRIRTSIYNLQLCLLDRRLWKYAVKSISDWKREYFPQCAQCPARSICGGVFTSAQHRHSDYIAPIKDEAGLALAEEMIRTEAS